MYTTQHLQWAQGLNVLAAWPWLSVPDWVPKSLLDIIGRKLDEEALRESEEMRRQPTISSWLLAQ